MCKSDSVFLLTKGPEATHLPRGALLITEEHQVKASNFIPLFLALLSLHCYMDFSLLTVSGGYSLVVVCRLLIVVAPLVAEHGL